MVTSRIWFTAAQKAELWKRWKNGQSAAAISRALEKKNKTGVERIVVNVNVDAQWRLLQANDLAGSHPYHRDRYRERSLCHDRAVRQ
jgi:hypothetical protein